MVINRDGLEIELTKEEIYEAYKEHVHEMCVSDTKAYIESKVDNPVKDEYIECLAGIMEDAHEHWETEPDYQNDIFEVFEGMVEHYGIDINDSASMEKVFGPVEKELDEEIGKAEYTEPRTETEAYERIIEGIKDAGWEVSGDYRDQEISLSGYSPCDRKFEYTIDFESPFELQQEIADHCDEFNMDYYIDTWGQIYSDDLSQYYAELGYSPFDGVQNDMAILVEDAKAIQEMHDDLLNGVCGFRTTDLMKSTEQLVDEIKETSESFLGHASISRDDGER